MKVFLILLFIFPSVVYSQLESNYTMKTVDSLDLEKYSGTWYEIYRLPMRAEKDLVNVTATYTLKENGKIGVLNQGFKHSPNGKHKKAKAIAWRPNNDNPGALKVRFFYLIRSSYNVFAIADDYSWAIVATDNKDYAWILSRNPEISSGLDAQLLQKAESIGINTAQFEKTLQQW